MCSSHVRFDMRHAKGSAVVLFTTSSNPLTGQFVHTGSVAYHF